jgi:hypothetical protein
MLNNFNMRAFRDTHGFKIIGHGNPDNNLESLCISLACLTRIIPIYGGKAGCDVYMLYFHTIYLVSYGSWI